MVIFTLNQITWDFYPCTVFVLAQTLLHDRLYQHLPSRGLLEIFILVFGSLLQYLAFLIAVTKVNACSKIENEQKNGSS